MLATVSAMTDEVKARIVKCILSGDYAECESPQYFQKVTELLPDGFVMSDGRHRYHMHAEELRPDGSSRNALKWFGEYWWVSYADRCPCER